jgi:mono/diheme cytochrome c family protein
MQILMRGANYRIKDQIIYMPSFAAGYTDAELSAVANYVIAHFSGQVARVTPQDIAKQRPK